MTRSVWGWLFGAVVVAFGAQACGDERGAPSGSAGSGAGMGSGAGSSSGGSGSGAGMGSGAGTSAGGAGYVPMFETDIVPLFEASCGASEVGCHVREAYGADPNFDCRGWLTLEDAPLGSVFYAGDQKGQPTGCDDIPLYDRLMMTAWQCGAPGTPGEAQIAYVVPCEPDQSYMLHKMKGTLLCEDPAGVGFDTMPPDENAKESDIAILTAWIEAGAPRVDGTGVDCGGGEGGGGGGPVGSAPSPLITHPSDGEMRPANIPVPLIGEASDPEDGQLAGSSLSWSSDLDGPLGTGASFDVTLSVGTHTLTLEATDSDGNTAADSIQVIMEP